MADIDDRNLDQKEASEQNYYRENMFSREDLHLYKGVMLIYVGRFEDAAVEFDKASQVMHAGKNVRARDDQSNHSDQTDLSDVGLCTLNVHEYTYNKLICLICEERFADAMQLCTYLIDTVPKKYLSQLWLLRAQISEKYVQTCKSSEKATIK